MNGLLNQLGTFLFALVYGLIALSPPAYALTVPAPSFTIFAEAVTPQNNGVIISWKTDLPTKGQVEYSGQNGHWAKTPWTQEYHYEHAFTILDLQPGTRYLYRINAEDVYGTTTSETDVFIAPGVEQPVTPHITPVTTAVLGEQTTPTVAPVEVAQLKETSTQYPQDVSTNTVSQSLLIIGGIIMGAGAVWLYQKSPHKLSISVVSTNPQKAVVEKVPKEAEAQKKVTKPKETKPEVPAEQKIVAPAPKPIEPKPNRFQFKINQ